MWQSDNAMRVEEPVNQCRAVVDGEKFLPPLFN
jgi:hypothetical protein